MAEKETKSTFKHIVRVANVDLPGEKHIAIAMTKIKGIGTNFAKAVCAVAGISISAKTGDLGEQEVAKLTHAITKPGENGIPLWYFNRKVDYDTGDDKHIITGDLIFTKENDLKRLKKIKSLRGMRHQKGLTVRGQRTRSNFRRNKGKVVGVKKRAGAKTGK
jgi:small subunit ribosomal protein S13